MKRSISTRPKRPESAEDDGPGIEEDRLDVEDEEEHRDEREANREAPAAPKSLGMTPLS